MDVEPTTSTSGQLLSSETSANGTSIVKILIEISAHERLSIPLQKSELPGVPKSRSGPIQAYVYIYIQIFCLLFHTSIVPREPTRDQIYHYCLP